MPWHITRSVRTEIGPRPKLRELLAQELSCNELGVYERREEHISGDAGEAV
jgi:hypothetical protein